MDEPKLTVVTVTLNCVKDIETTIQSVINQRYNNLEYIIIDGGSSDGTINIINKYSSKISKILIESDKGIYDAMNKGLSMATGKWIAFMNAGDYYSNEDVLSILMQDIKNDSSAKVVYGDTIYLEKDGSSNLQRGAGKEKLKKIISKYQPYTHQAVLYEISNLEDCRYNLKYKITADYDVCCRYWRKYGYSSYHYIPIVVCYYKNFDGLSSNPNVVKIINKEHLLIKFRNRMNIFEMIKNLIRYIF